MGRRRYRQLFLFLAVLILPGVMIAVQGWRLSVQGRSARWNAVAWIFSADAHAARGVTRARC
jgi:hypothetical protein